MRTNSDGARASRPPRRLDAQGACMTAATGRRMTRTALALWLLAGLFCLRVLGQVLVEFGDVQFLPPSKEWASGLIPYPLLLVSQVLINCPLGEGLPRFHATNRLGLSTPTARRLAAARVRKRVSDGDGHPLWFANELASIRTLDRRADPHFLSLDSGRVRIDCGGAPLADVAAAKLAALRPVRPQPVVCVACPARMEQ